jgi:hypothetical protein
MTTEQRALEEAHDLHIFDAEDAENHPDDCQYCKLVAEADALLKQQAQ